jgi:hypothetical protein
MIREFRTGDKLIISRPSLLKVKYELILGKSVVGRIIFPKAMGTLAEVELFNEEWSLKRMGFWKPFITVRRKPEEKDLFQIPITGGWKHLLSLTIPGTNHYEMVLSGFWNPRWIWKSQNRELIGYQVKLGMKKFAEVQILDQDPYLNLLLIIGAYGLIMRNREEGATTAAVTAAIA